MTWLIAVIALTQVVQTWWIIFRSHKRHQELLAYIKVRDSAILKAEIEKHG